MAPFNSIFGEEKKIIASISLVILMVFTLHGYISTIRTFFDPENSEKLEDSLLRAGAYNGGGRGGVILLPLPKAWEIDIRSAEDGYSRLERFTPEEIAGVLNDVKISKTAAILPYFEISKAIEIIKEMSANVSSEVLFIMDIELAVEIISGLDIVNADIIQNMISSNLMESAIRIEETVKKLIRGLSNVERTIALENISSILSELPIDSLLDLFLEITSLPETPSIVSYLLESMDITNSVSIIETWVETQDYTDIGEVFHYFSVDFLSKIYRRISDDSRDKIYPYLDSETIENLPSFVKFQASNLRASPGEIEPGDEITIFFTLRNVGNETGDYSIDLKFNDESVEVYSGVLESGGSESFIYSQIVEEIGEYDVQVLDESITFNSIDNTPILSPAQIIISFLEVIPSEVLPGDDLIVIVEVSNEGETSGLEVLEFRVDDIVVETKMAQVSGGGTTTLYFDYTADLEPGSYIAEINDRSTSFNVVGPAASIPWLTITVTGIVLLGGVVYILNERGIIKIPYSITSLIGS